MTQLVSREMNSASAECISAARPYAIGTRITTVVMREIHIGVIVSGADGGCDGFARAAHNAGKDLRDGHCNVTDGENAHHVHAGINDFRRARKHFHEITAEEQNQRNKYHGNGKAEL